MFNVNGLIEITGEEHDPDIVRYGVDILTDGIITFMTILCLGVITHCLVESLIYMIFSVCGTATMGGYHCKTRKSCFFLTIILWILTICMNLVFKYFFVFPWYLVMLGLTAVLVYFYAPVVHENKNVSDAVWKKNRRIALWMETGTTVLIIILHIMNWKLAGIFLVNKVEIVILMVMGRRKGLDAKEKKCKITD